jgi:GntR family transcriptional regulator
MSQMIDRTSPTPYYEQLFEVLRAQIAEGTMPRGERLPSEGELCREYGLSRATVRQTLQKLDAEGWARRVAGRGVFAASPAEPSGWIVQDAAGFLESQLRHGATGIATQVISASWVVPAEHVAVALGLQPGEEAFALERVRSMDGELAMFSTNWFPGQVGQLIAAADDVLQGTGSVNATLARGGYVTAGARRVMRALRAPDGVAGHLHIRKGEPVLRVRSQSWDQHDVKFDYYETWVLTDVVPLEVNVTAG